MRLVFGMLSLLIVLAVVQSIEAAKQRKKLLMKGRNGIRACFYCVHSDALNSK